MNVTETTVLTRLPSGTPGRYWHQLGDGRIQCDLCPRFCKLREGQRGLCFVRARHNDAIILTTYGRILHRPDREEAAQPLSAGHAGALVWDRRVQPHV